MLLQRLPEATPDADAWNRDVMLGETLAASELLTLSSRELLRRLFHEEDLGQTLGFYGVGPGPYLVLPLFGPSSGRDAVGLIGDYFTDPVTYIEDDSVRWGLRGLNLVDTRADLLSASRVLEQAALDRYSFVRDAFLQRFVHSITDIFRGQRQVNSDGTVIHRGQRCIHQWQSLDSVTQLQRGSTVGRRARHEP